MLTSLAADLRQVLRVSVLYRWPTTVAAVLTIALVTGAGATVWAFLSVAVTRPLPYPESDRLVAPYTQPPHTSAAADRNGLRPLEFLRFRGGLPSADAIEGAWPAARILGTEAEPVSVPAAKASSGYIALLGGRAALGRLWTEDEDRADARVVVISDGLWRRQFGADPGLVGRTVLVDREAHVVLGVLAPGFRPSSVVADLWAPLSMHSAAGQPNATVFTAVARLAPLASFAALNGEIASAMADVVRASPGQSDGTTAGIMPLRERDLGGSQPPLLLLAAAVGGLALIAAVNLSNLQLARVIAERHDLALRLALGATTTRLLRVRVVEGIVLACAGGALGALIARAAVPLVLSIDPVTAATLGAVPFDAQVAGAALALAALMATMSGVLPTWREARRDLAATVSAGSRRSTGSAHDRRLRRRLIIAESALALVLLTVSSVLGAALLRTSALDPGFDASHVLAGQIRMPAAVYPTLAARAAFVDAVLERVRALPGVAAVSTTQNPMLPGANYITEIKIEGQPAPDGSGYTTDFRRISAGYFDTMRIPIIAGRALGAEDRSDTLPVVVVSRAAAERFWPGTPPLGRRIQRGNAFLTIVGIAEDVRDLGQGTPPRPTVYLPFTQSNTSTTPTTLVVRTAGDPAAMAVSVNAAVLAVDPSQPIERPTTVQAFFDAALGPQRFRSTLVALLAMMGLLLTCVGIYGVTAAGVEERTREMGVRLVLGASPSGLRTLVVGQALRDVAWGVAAGAALSGLAAGAIGRGIGGLEWSDGRMSLLAVAVLALAAAAASFLPARRASRADPAEALRA